MARWLAARWWRVTAPESLGEVLTGAVAGAVGALERRIGQPAYDCLEGVKGRAVSNE